MTKEEERKELDKLIENVLLICRQKVLSDSEVQAIYREYSASMDNIMKD